MKVSLSWLKEFTDIDLKVDELVVRIGAQLGAVEEVVDLGRKYQGIIIVRVVSCEKHPNADKLSVCWVDDAGKAGGVERNDSGHVQVVCGAPNVKPGMLAVWLPPGSTVPSSHDKEPFILGARELRGVISNGMLASAHELGISDDHSGIVGLHPRDAKPGADFATTYKLTDHIIDIENKMFTHRPDCFGQLGVAREVAGILGNKFQSPDWYKDSDTTQIKPESEILEFKVDNSIPGLVPRFTAAVLRDIKVGPSPFWLQTYLSRVGIRPINNIVDLTNYYMVLTGQPLHAYDYDKLPAKSLETRLANSGEKLTLLGGKTVEFNTDDTILITSGGKPVGIGGVMGGQDTEVSESTKNIVIECANFDMYSIRRTSMAYGLFTDAVTRFSKGQSAHQTDKVIARIIQDIQELAGGRIANKLTDDKAGLKRPVAVHARADFINSRLGTDLDIKQMAKLLDNVEFDVRINGPTLAVTPPFWRTDIEIPEDIVEEVGRLHGFDNVRVELPRRLIRPADRDAMLQLKSRIRNILSRAGANEVLTYSFVHGNLLEKVGQNKEKAFKLSNALSPDLQYYRLSLTPSLLEKIHSNVKVGFEQFCIFEIGKTHNKEHSDDENYKLPKELEKTSLVFAGTSKALHESGAPYYFARKYLDALVDGLGLDVSYRPLDKEVKYETAKPFDPERSAEVIDLSSGLVLGVVGEYTHSVITRLKLPKFSAGFELSTLKLMKSVQPQLVYRPLSRYPKVTQDISLKVPADMAYGDLYDFIDTNLEVPDSTTYSLEPVDIYQKASDKHVTLRLIITSYDRTLTDVEVNKILDDVAEKAHDKLNVRRI